MKNTVLIQCGDVNENITRILPLMETYRSYGWTPIALQYSDQNKNRILERGFERLALQSFDDKKNVAYKESYLYNSLNLEACYAYDVRKLTRNSRGVDTAPVEREYVRLGYRVQRMMEAVKPDRLIVWNGWTGAVANVLHYIKQVNRLEGGFLERGFFSDTVFFDEAGVNGHSVLARGVGNSYSREQIADARQKFDGTLDDLFDYDLIDKHAERKNKIIFLPLQVQDDSNIILHSKHLINMRMPVLRALELAQALGPEWKILVREHPEELQDTVLDIPVDRRINFDSHGDLDEQIDEAGMVYTINSSVGLKAAIRGAPVIVGGDGIFCAEPFVVRDEMGAVGDIVAAIDKWKLSSSATRESSLRNFLSVLLGYHQAGDRWASLNVPFFEMPQNDGIAQKYSPTRKKKDVNHKINEIKQQAGNTGRINVDLYMDFKTRRILTYRITRPVTKDDIVQLVRGRFGDQLEINIFDGNKVQSRHHVGVFVGAMKRRRDLWRRYDISLDEFGAVMT